MSTIRKTTQDPAACGRETRATMRKRPLGLWIPPGIKADERLTLLEKFILSTIVALCGREGCYASNRYIADECGCKTTKVSQTIAKGVELGYIVSEYEPGAQRIIRTPSHARTSPLTPADAPPLHPQTGPDEKLPSIIKDTIKDTIVYTEGAEKNIPTLEEVRDWCREKGLSADPERFWNYYNSVGWMRGNTPVRDWRSLLAVWREFDKERMEKSGGSFQNSSFDTEDFFQAALKKAYGT